MNDNSLVILLEVVKEQYQLYQAVNEDIKTADTKTLLQISHEKVILKGLIADIEQKIEEINDFNNKFVNVDDK